MAAFEVRRVDIENRKYVKVGISYRHYHDACIAADIAWSESDDDFIVWNADEKKPEPYDTRLFASKKLKRSTP